MIRWRWMDGNNMWVYCIKYIVGSMKPLDQQDRASFDLIEQWLIKMEGE